MSTETTSYRLDTKGLRNKERDYTVGMSPYGYFNVTNICHYDELILNLRVTVVIKFRLFIKKTHGNL